MKRVFPLLAVTLTLAAGAYGGYQYANLRGEPAQTLTLDQSARNTAPAQSGESGTAPDAETETADARVTPAPTSATEVQEQTGTLGGALARTESEQNTAAVVKGSADGLVYIETTSTVQPSLQEQMFGQMFGQGQVLEPQEREGLGSGFFVTQSGDIITNYHVIEGAEKVSLRVHGDSKSYAAEVVGVAPDYDLALIRSETLPKDRIRPLPLGDDGTLEVGLKAIALGAPFGLDFSVSEGIISSLERKAPVGVGDVTQPVLQTDAAINPGNSGGPLLNSAGQVIGVNTQIATGGIGQSAGVGFAIPISTVKNLLPQLQAGQKVTTPALGVSMLDLSEVDPAKLEQYGLPSAGIMLMKIDPSGPAAKTDLKVARPVQQPDGSVAPSTDSDIITAVDGQQVETAEDLRSSLIGKKAGDTLTLTVQRGKQTVDIPVKLTDYTLTE